MFELVLDIRTSLNHVIGANNPKDIWVELVCKPEVYKKLQVCIFIFVKYLKLEVVTQFGNNYFNLMSFMYYSCSILTQRAMCWTNVTRNYATYFKFLE